MEDYKFASELFENRIQDTLESTFTEGIPKEVISASIKEARNKYNNMIQNGYDYESAIKHVTADLSNYLISLTPNDQILSKPLLIFVSVIAIICCVCWYYQFFY